jgi:hypothetical protein
MRVQWWHAALGLVVVGAVWRGLGAPATVTPEGDETMQLRARSYALPSEYWHYSPVTWAGRRHPYPKGIGEGLGHLHDRSAPDWADCDR